VIEFKLPSMGADMDEGKLLEWKVKPGDAVKRGQVIAVVDTSKAAVEIEVWHDGVVAELLAKPGDNVPVGTVIAHLDGAGEKPKEIGPALRKPASPAARKRARELDVDIEKVSGTGPHGAVTVEDVEKFGTEAKKAVEKKEVPKKELEKKELEKKELEKKEVPAAPAPSPDKALEMRKAIAAAMARSKREIPHYYLSQTVPMQRALDWLAAENAKRPITGRLLMAVLQLKAVALALADFPDLNGFYRDGAHQPSAAVHAGVAISLRQGGLVAPAIHDVAELSLDDLMKALSDLVRRARAGSLRSSEMSDPTITVTNLGEGGVESVFPIIYPPQVAIVGFGTLAQRPWATPDGGLRAMPTVVASLGADHRASDGHRGALFLAELARRLQEPESL
jgi:pyruvate dehydrogenase E2 component (dihydrolipoamide acetyltransferase)